MSSLVLAPKSPSSLHLDPVSDVALESAQALTCFHFRGPVAGGPLMARGCWIDEGTGKNRTDVLNSQPETMFEYVSGLRFDSPALFIPRLEHKEHQPKSEGPKGHLSLPEPPRSPVDLTGESTMKQLGAGQL